MSAPALLRLRRLLPPGRPAAMLWLLFIALSVALACALNVWTDEAYSLHTTAGTARETLQQALRFEQQPPGYFLSLWLWRRIDGGPLWARLLSVVYASLAVRLAAPLARRYAPSLDPAWAVGLGGFNPFVLFAAVEIRLYALALLLSALLLLLFHDGYLVDAPRRGRRLLHGLCAVAAACTQYFLGALLVGGGAALLALRRRDALRAYVGAMALVGACLVPLLLQVPRQVHVHLRPSTDRTTLLQAAHLVYQRVGRLLFPVEGLGDQGRSWVPRALLCGLGLLLVRRVRRAPVPSAQVALLVLVAAMVLCFVPVGLLMGAFMRYRHLAGLFVPLLIAVLVVLGDASARERAGFVALTAVLYGASIYSTYRPLSKGIHWGRVSAWLTTEVPAGEPILVFKADSALPLSLYYRGPSRLVPLPAENRFDTFDMRDYVVAGPDALSRRLAEGAGDAPRIWLLTDGECRWMEHLDFRCDLLEAFFAARYATLRDERVHAARVRLLVRLPPPPPP